MNDTGTLSEVTENQAKDQFLDFIDWLNDEKAASPDQTPAFGYRIDTWQLWHKCTQRADQHETLCKAPGTYIIVDAPNSHPFVVMVGPFVLFRERFISSAFRGLFEATTAILQANGHSHVIGQPHHESCELCHAEKPPQLGGGFSQ